MYDELSLTSDTLAKLLIARGIVFATEKGNIIASSWEQAEDIAGYREDKVLGELVESS